MADRDEDWAELSVHFTRFALTTASRAPLYAALSRHMAATPRHHALLDPAPAMQRLPVLYFAIVHDLVLAHPDAELARWYATVDPAPRAPDDPALSAAWDAFVDEHGDEIRSLAATRTTQTNEVGRCGLFVPALGTVEAEVGPLALVDVGTSAGLNLLLDRYAYRYTPRRGGRTDHLGESPATLDVSTTGHVPVPEHLPTVAGGVGIDRAPIDVTDDDAARWLQACVWPDQLDRFNRLRAALAIARLEPPTILTGDAVALVGDAVAEMRRHGHPVVVNSWVLSYFTPDERADYLAALDRAGADGDLSWLSLEAPAQTPGLPMAPDLAGSELTVLSLTRWRQGARTVEHLATCHPHGYWLDWRAA